MICTYHIFEKKRVLFNLYGDEHFTLFCFFFFKQRKASRLAYIENEDVTSICSDQDSVSCGNNIQNRDDCDLSDGDAEIVDLINRVEHMKQERSILWLLEFKESMHIGPGKFVESSKGRSQSHPRKENYVRDRPSQGQPVEVSRYASDSVQTLGDESNLNNIECESSLIDTSASLHSQQYFRGLLGNVGGFSLKSNMSKGINSVLSQFRSSHSDICTIQAHTIAENRDSSPVTIIDALSGSHSSSMCPSSPPHFQEDLLQRRQNLVEEILQLSADSFSVASSDSNTSCSEVDSSGFEQSVPEIDNFLTKDYDKEGVDEHMSPSLPKDKFDDQRQEFTHVRENGIYAFDLFADQTSKQCSNDFAAGADNGESAYFCNQDANWLENRKSRKKVKKRFISNLESSDSNACNHESEFKQEKSKQISHAGDFEIVGNRQMSANCKRKMDLDDVSELSVAYCCTQENIDLIVTYFNTNIANLEAHEICSHCMRSNCVLQRESTYKER